MGRVSGFEDNSQAIPAPKNKLGQRQQMITVIQENKSLKFLNLNGNTEHEGKISFFQLKPLKKDNLLRGKSPLLKE